MIAVGKGWKGGVGKGGDGKGGQGGDGKGGDGKGGDRKGRKGGDGKGGDGSGEDATVIRGLYTCECPLLGLGIYDGQCELGWHTSAQSLRCIVRDHLCGPTHNLDRDEAWAAAGEATWNVAVDPHVQFTDLATPSPGRRSRSRSRARSWERDRDARMYEAARDAAHQVANLGAEVSRIFGQRAAEFEDMHIASRR